MSLFSILNCNVANYATWSFLLDIGEGKGILTHSFNAILVCFNLCSHTKLGEPLTNCDQAWEIVSINPALSIQSRLNRKGIGPNFSSFWNNRAMGWWSEESFGRILVETIKFPSNKELWTRKRSSLAKMLATPTLWFEHVNRPDLGFKSFKSQTWINSSSISCKWSLPCVPPLFSLEQE